MTAIRFWALTLAALFVTNAAIAQGRFDTVVEVGDEVVTRYQLDQRTLFLSLLRAPGDVRTLAREQLINETLQLAAARDEGITPSAEEITAGIEEFAARANLTGEEFLTALAQNGVEGQTFRDFITAGVAWRQYVRNVLGDDAREFDTYSLRLEYDRTGTEGGIRVKLSEIVLPATDEATREASLVRARTLSEITDPEEFARAARIFSVGSSAANGGEIGWRAVETLPEDMQRLVSTLPVEGTSPPVVREGSIAIYRVEARETIAPGAPSDPRLDYALLAVASAGEGAAISARVDVCDDLYGVAKVRGGAEVFRETAPNSSLPAELARAAATLDENEATVVSLSTGPALLMLCERGAAGESTADYEIIGNRILNRRLAIAAAGTLADMRARTHVRILD